VPALQPAGDRAAANNTSSVALLVDVHNLHIVKHNADVQGPCCSRAGNSRACLAVAAFKEALILHCGRFYL
jgi:hypothetical protein